MYDNVLFQIFSLHSNATNAVGRDCFIICHFCGHVDQHRRARLIHHWRDSCTNDQTLLHGVIAINYQNVCFGCMEDKGADKSCSHCGYQEGTTSESILHLPPGTILQGKYLLGRALGQGGFGTTYLAWDKTLKIKLAIKEYLPQQLVTRIGGSHKVTVYKASLSEDFTYGLSRFLEEAQTLAHFIEHPNVASVRDYFEANGTAYLVMNYHEGITLQNYLADKGGKISVEQALSIFMPVLDALKEVHAAGILHRDISPDNLLIDKNGRVILIDFGAARQAMGDKSKSLSVIMKAGYSPPEQYQSRGKQGPWTDIYAVAASFYRAITGVAPAEAFDRVMEDSLDNPATLGIEIDNKVEEALLKALAVKTGERYQMVEQFQKALVASPATGQAREGYAVIRSKEKAGIDKGDIKSGGANLGQKAKEGPLAEAGRVPVKKPLFARQPADRGSKQETSYTISRKIVKIAVFIVACALLLFGSISFLGSGSRADLGRPLDVDPGHQSGEELTADLTENEEQQPTYDLAVIAALDAEYYIDYENGTIPIGDLPIGRRVVDPSWEWEFRTGDNYSGSGEVKPVTWIVVAKDHYSSLGSHVTLLSEELIGLFAFDNSTNRGDERGINHWGDSGTANATHGLCPWLNSTGIHSGEGFYRAFSENFKGTLRATTLPNREWKNGNAYSTQDYVFIPSNTEMGDSAHNNTYQIGTAYAYFTSAGDAKRVALLDGETWSYWTRSPASYYGYGVRLVDSTGEFYYYFNANRDYGAVRPALNLKSRILVSEIRN